MQIVIPMSGMGRRFKEEGYTDPKPLIMAGDKHLIGHVLDMFRNESDILCICHTDHLQHTDMENIIHQYAPNAKVIGINKTTWDGPVPDILAMQEHIKDNDPALVSYCDFTVEWDWEDFKKTVVEKGYDGAIISYKGFHPHHFGSTYYGYMQVDQNSLLLEIREKEPFTNNRLEEHAAAGSYYFNSGALMKKYLSEAVGKDLHTKGEYYVSMPYNLMVRDGLKTYIYEIPKFIQLGTPHDVRVYQYWWNYFRKHI